MSKYALQFKNKWDKKTIQKVAKGAVIAGGGAAMVFALQQFSEMDFGVYTPLVVALCSIGINAVKEYKAGE